jgi:hypothetical protein
MKQKSPWSWWIRSRKSLFISMRWVDACIFYINHQKVNCVGGCCMEGTRKAWCYPFIYWLILDDGLPRPNSSTSGGFLLHSVGFLVFLWATLYVQMSGAIMISVCTINGHLSSYRFTTHAVCSIFSFLCSVL